MLVLLIGMVSFPVSTCPLEFHSLRNNYQVSPLFTHPITFDVVVVSGVVALVHPNPISSLLFHSLPPLGTVALVILTLSLFPILLQ